MIRLRLSLLALVLVACNRDKAPQSGIETAAGDSLAPAETPAETAAAPAAAPVATPVATPVTTPVTTPTAAALRGARLVRSDTTRFTDSVRVGDTVSFQRGYRVLMTLVESTWTRRPPVALGIPSGPFHLPIDSLCKQQSLGYNGSHLNGYAPTLLRDLARVKSCKGRVMLGVMRSKLKPVGADTGFSVARAKAEIDSWPDIGPYIRDSTIIAIYIGDDISADEWGEDTPMPQRLARWDSVYALVHAPHRWPGVATAIRAKPTELAKWGWKGKHLTTAWAQYRGPYRDPEPKEWVREMVASARAQHLGLVIGLNLLDGGCGPPVLPSGQPNTKCLPNVPGTGILGTTKDAGANRRFQVSPAEYLYYKTVFLAEPYNCASIDWQWSPVWRGGGRPLEQSAGAQTFHTRTEVKAAAKALGVIARQRAYTSCIQKGT